MGTDGSEVVETVRIPQTFKVHRLICMELMKLVERISRIVPEIEAARPRCSTGIQALCLLTRGLEKAKLVLQYCCDSSKLYLAVTGDVIVSRCQRSRSLLEQSLHEIQNWVPVMLVAEISQIVDNLKGAIFVLDPSEVEAGRVVKELLQQDASQSNSKEDSEIKALQIASFRLHITSSKAILIEKRSIKKLLEKVGDSDPRKKTILTYFMYLLKKYGNSILGKQTERATAQQGSFASENSLTGFAYNQHAEAEPHIGHREYEAQSNLFHEVVPPVEFLCGISSRIMYDPVVIATGQTFERRWIQKWFDEGHDTCPKTNLKLTHLLLTPNIGMKDLISRWCSQYGVTIPNPSVQPKALSWETDSVSIASLGSSMNDLCLQMDISSMLFGSLETSFNSDASRTKMERGLSLVQSDDDSVKYQYAKKGEMDSVYLSKLDELEWGSQCKAVEEVQNQLRSNPQSSYSMTSKNFVEPLIKFLRDAHDLDDVKAQRDGFKALSNYISESRDGIRYLHEEAYKLLASYLDSHVTKEVLAIMEVLSGHQNCVSKISESGALTALLKLLDSQMKDLQGMIINILYNLSSNRSFCSKIVSLECIPKLVSFFQDGPLARNCISILKNLCNTEEARTAIAESNGCIAAVAEVLENGSSDDQEHAVAILLSLCSQHDDYCQLVMHEGVIPSLVFLSKNGKERTMKSAREVLQLLRDIKYVDEQECSGSDLNASRDNDKLCPEKKSSKTAGFFGNKILRFAPKKKK